MESAWCVSICENSGGNRELQSSLEAHCSRIAKLAEYGSFDFFSAHHFCSLLSSSRDPDEMKSLVSVSVGILRDFSRVCVSACASAEMVRLMQGFDGLVSCLLNDRVLKEFEEAVYLSLMTQMGEKVFKGVFCENSSWFKLKRFNCDSFLNDCFSSWKESLHPELRQHLLSNVSGWSTLERQLRRRDFSDKIYASPRGGDSNSLYDFCPVALRSPIYTSSGTGKELSRIHVSYFRYLVSKRALARHIIFLVNSHNVQISSTSEHVNDSNVTVINNTPHGRRDSRDSANSYMSADYSAMPVNSYDDLISSHCASFLAAFGTGLVLQITNDVVNALLQPPTEFLRLMIDLHPTEASAEGHEAVRKYLCSQLLLSLRSLIHNRGNRSVGEDACLSFFMKAEMSLVSYRSRRSSENRIVSALIHSALALAIATISGRRRKRWSLFQKGAKSDVTLVAWLEYLSDSNLVTSMTSSGEARKELRAIYREISAASVNADSASGWEEDLCRKIICCPRMLRSDFRLLFTSANGLGITPVPVGALTLSETGVVFFSAPSSVHHPVSESCSRPASPLNDVSPSPPSKCPSQQEYRESQMIEARFLLMETAITSVRDEILTLAQEIRHLKELLPLKDHEIRETPSSPSPNQKAEAIFKQLIPQGVAS